VERAIDEDTMAIMVEPIQGEGGIVVPPEGYLRELKNICEKHNILLILDEVQTGIGRCGALFAHQLEGVEPDIITSAKALGNGFPIGACLVNEKVKSAITPGTHASTFGGNPLATRVALEVLKTVLEEELPKHAHEMGTTLMSELKNLPGVYEVRGRGLLIGITVDDSRAVVQKALENGLLLVPAGERVVRLLPPLNVTIRECEEALEKLRKSLG
jgi:acetylornithine/succinyldiaminopimelate/putrescine aminotransferase